MDLILKFMKKEFVIGIDVSKEKLDICLLKHGSSEALEERVIKNNHSEIEKYLERVCKKVDKSKLVVCLEHTGYYGLTLCVVMQKLEIDFTLVPALEIKNTQGITRGKTDKVDALRIAMYAWRYLDKLKPTVLPGEELLLCKELLALRDQNVKMSVQLQNSLKSHSIVSSLLNNTVVVDRIKKQIVELKKEIEEIEKQLEELINTSENLKINFNLLKSIKGIGQITALVLIITTQNFQSFRDGRKYSSYAGLAPFRHESGKMNKGSRVSNLANKKIKTLLHNGACTAINCDPELKLYYKRKTEEGKAKLSVLNAGACKLLYRVFAIINRQTPYVNLYQNNFA